MGDLEHGINLINEFSKVCKKYKQFSYAFKFQYRQLDTFIHKDFKNRNDLHFIKRFKDTELKKNDFEKMLKAVRKNGYYTMVTAFDNESYKIISMQDYDLIKIASCSFNDWPLLEDAVTLNKPIIASTAGATQNEIDNVASFFFNRSIEFALMHCVAEYPTKDVNMGMSQIDYLQKRFPGVPIGFSTHENPDSFDFVKIAIGKNATLFEKHVALPTDKYKKNDYSVDPNQFENWLKAAIFAKKVCGPMHKRKSASKIELDSLNSLKRGLFSKKDLLKGQKLTADDVYLAFPPSSNQLKASDFSKHNQVYLTKNILKDAALTSQNTRTINTRTMIEKITNNVRKIVNKSSTHLPSKISMEISHHYGLDKFDKFGMVIFTLINRAYCKKLLILLPGQSHPEQFHKNKEETFRLIYGDLELKLDNKKNIMKLGDVITVNRSVIHSFKSKKGCIIEEVSDTHHQDDSYYLDSKIANNLNRKTFVNFYS